MGHGIIRGLVGLLFAGGMTGVTLVSGVNPTELYSNVATASQQPAAKIERKSARPSYFNNLSEGQYMRVPLHQWASENYRVDIHHTDATLKATDVVVGRQNGVDKEYVRLVDANSNPYFYTAGVDGAVRIAETLGRLQGISGGISSVEINEGQIADMITESADRRQDPVPRLNQTLGTKNPLVTKEAVERSTSNMYVSASGRVFGFVDYIAGADNQGNYGMKVSASPERFLYMEGLRQIGIDGGSEIVVADWILDDKDKTALSVTLQGNRSRGAITDINFQQGQLYRLGERTVMIAKSWDWKQSQPNQQYNERKPDRKDMLNGASRTARETTPNKPTSPFTDATQKAQDTARDTWKDVKKEVGEIKKDVGDKLRDSARDGNRQQDQGQRGSQTTDSTRQKANNFVDKTKDAVDRGVDKVTDFFKKK